MKAWYELGAVEAARAIRDGAITSEALGRSCLARIAAADERIGAWAFLDREGALKQAARADAARWLSQTFRPSR